VKILILAIDGLEYNLVQEFSLTNLMQQQHGTIDVTEYCKYHYTDTPATPIIWASFITGKMPEEHGIMLNKKYQSKTLEIARKTAQAIGLGRIRGKARVLRAFGAGKLTKEGIMQNGPEYYHNKGLPTIFNLAQQTVARNVPTWNYHQDRNLLAEYFDGKIDQHRLTVVLNLQLYADFEYAQKTAQTEYDLMMIYMESLDLIGHAMAGDLYTMQQFYKTADKLTAKLQKTIPEDSFLLIASDHGMQPKGQYGDHTNHAYYSANQPLEQPPTKITDYYHLIQKILAENP